MTRATLISAAVCLLALPLQLAMAQDKPGEPTRLEIKDGRLLLDGKDVGSAGNGQIEFKGQDGRTVIIQSDGSKGIVWTGRSFPEARAFFHADSIRTTLPRGYMLDLDADSDPLVRMDELRDRMARWTEPSENSPFRGRMFELGIDRPSSPALGFFLDEMGPGSSPPDPEVLNMERRIQELGRRARRASDADRAELEAELDQLLNEAFDLKLETERKQVEKLENRLDALRERLDDRAGSREEIIARKRAELLGQRDILDW